MSRMAWLRLLLGVSLVLGSSLRAGAEGGAPGVSFEMPSRSWRAINNVLFAATGRLFVSSDGGGSTGSTYTVQVQKPSGAAKVRRAFLMAASTGFSNFVIPNGNTGVRLNGTGIVWEEVIPNGIVSWNHEADVTSLVKPGVDAAGAGRSNFTVTEGNPLLIEGVVLVVVFDDPNQPADSTVSLLFGSQSPTGDRFSINLAQTINPNAANSRFTLGLGISYGAQASCANGIQFSRIDVNGRRLTSSAGGEDDGSCADGALITVGGLDDSTNNPGNPNAGPGGNPRADDELYSLLPFITSSTRQIEVSTVNPSLDDNIFFAYFQVSGSASISSGSCVAGATVLCIDDQPGDRRFRVEVAFATQQSGGLRGDGQAIPLSSLGVRRGGLFWFFGADNPEMLVKVLNGCALNNRYWVFYSAGTNVGFTLKVTDTVTGRIFESRNPDLRAAPPVTSTDAIACN